MNGNALRFIEATFTERQNIRVQKHGVPAELVGWPRWKRCRWMAKRLGPTWKLQIFRESRRVKAKTSLFWNAAQDAGFAMPNRRKKPKPNPKVKVAGVAFDRVDGAQGAQVNVRYIDDLIADAVRAQDPEAIPAGGLRGNADGNIWQNLWHVDPPVVAVAPAPGVRNVGHQYAVNYGHQRINPINPRPVRRER